MALREAHEEAVQKSLAIYNASAVGVGSMRKKYEELLQKFFRKAFEVCSYSMATSMVKSLIVGYQNAWVALTNGIGY